MRFIKMHGIGNDYVFINGFENDVNHPDELVRKIADRHFGVGGDGLILVLPPEDGIDAHVRMRMFNADGSEAEMCGNGIRCVCKLAHDQGISQANPMLIQTGRGVLSIRYTLDQAGKLDQADVDMGAPILAPSQIPVNIRDLGQIVNHPIAGLIEWPKSLASFWIVDSGLDPRLTCVSMGNPHTVFYCRDVSRIPTENGWPIP